MRLTGKNKNGKYGFITENNTLGVFDDNSIADKCYTKLGQLEDIEDKLGIDLKIIGMLLLQDDVYVDGIGYVKFKLSKNGISFMPRVGVWCSVAFEDFGKTWALTKEGLL